MKGLLHLVGILVALIVVGTVGFRLIEGASWLDSVYMTVITLTTVGYREVFELTDPGKVFVMLFLAAGIGVFLYSVAQIGEFVVRAEMMPWLERRRKDTAMKSLEGHFIVCGFGRMGHRICSQLAARDLPFVVVERSEEALGECRESSWNWVLGDATDERVLGEAGIERARGIATVLGSDADNLYIVLSARLLRGDVLILARAGDEGAAEKMKRAGADRVVSLYATGATKIVQLLSSPNVEEFIELISDKGREMNLAEIHVTAKAPYSGRTLAESNLRDRGLMVVGIRRAGGELLMPPPSTAAIASGRLPHRARPEHRDQGADRRVLRLLRAAVDDGRGQVAPYDRRRLDAPKPCLEEVPEAAGRGQPCGVDVRERREASALRKRPHHRLHDSFLERSGEVRPRKAADDAVGVLLADDVEMEGELLGRSDDDVEPGMLDRQARGELLVELDGEVAGRRSEFAKDRVRERAGAGT